MRKHRSNPKSFFCGALLMMASMSFAWAQKEPTREEIERALIEGIPHPVIIRQEKLMELLDQIQTEYPANFIGGEHGKVGKIYIKGEAPEGLRDLVEKSGLRVKLVDKQRYSMAEMDEMAEQAEAILTKAGYTFEASSIGVPNEIWLQIGLVDGLPTSRKDILKLLPEELANAITLETVGGKKEAPGMIGYVVAVGEDGDSFLLTAHEPDKGRLACNNAIHFADEDCGLKVGQKVMVWFSGVAQSYPGQSSAIRTKLVEDEIAGKSAAIRLAMEKRKKAGAAGIPYVVSAKRDNAAKQWTILFASDANDGKPDAQAYVVADKELAAAIK